MEYEFELKKFTEKFYFDRNKNLWYEVLTNENRAYNCIVIDTYYDFLCVFHLEVICLTNMVTDLRNLHVQN